MRFLSFWDSSVHLAFAEDGTLSSHWSQCPISFCSVRRACAADGTLSSHWIQQSKASGIGLPQPRSSPGTVMAEGSASLRPSSQLRGSDNPLPCPSGSLMPAGPCTTPHGIGWGAQCPLPPLRWRSAAPSCRLPAQPAPPLPGCPAGVTGWCWSTLLQMAPPSPPRLRLPRSSARGDPC